MTWAPDYVDSTDFSSFTGVTLDATVVAAAISTASRQVDGWAGRQFGQVAEAESRSYTARPDYRRGLWVVDVDDLMVEPESVTVNGTALTYRLEPVNAPAKGRPWTLLEVDAESSALITGAPFEVDILAQWGWSAIPGPVEYATLLQANRLAARRKSPHGLAGSPDMGTELRFLARLDPDAQAALADYRRRRPVG